MKKFMVLLLLVLAACVSAAALTPHRWLHVYRHSRCFTSVKVDDLVAVAHDINSADGPAMSIMLRDSNMHVPVADIVCCEIGSNVPTVYINTIDCPDLEDLTDKDTYLNATIRIDGNGHFIDLPATNVSIKGRGNSTWQYPKKPYRLKFNKKTSILDFPKAKSYALIANYIDCSLMRNAVALKAAQLLGMPYTNHVQPVRVVFNGTPKGAYFITEKIGINSSSVDIDESEGVLLDLDNNIDETYVYRSKHYDLPVMVKDPDMAEIAASKGMTADEYFGLWAEDFQAFEDKVYDSSLADGADIDWASLVDYVLVYNLCGNRELTWPKSTYMYKPRIDAPYAFGPVWDFDWAFTYSNGSETLDASGVLLPVWQPLLGQPFFKKLCSDGRFLALFAERWLYFRQELLPQLLDYIDEYAAVIRPSALENGVLWPASQGVTVGSFDFDTNVANLKAWIAARAEYISTHPHYGIYQ